MKTLTRENRDVVQNAMADAVLNSMSQEELENFAYLQLLDSYDKLSNVQFTNLVKTFCPDLLK
ncbi:MAG: hypothetical protein EBU90_23080 [Proteobacteria bacterium]|nr:hypothetical protein [Pseudomonadota bacterium]